MTRPFDPVSESPDTPTSAAVHDTDAAETPPLRRYCGRCGTPIEPESGACVRCDAPSAEAAAPADAAEPVIDSDVLYRSPRPFADVIGLYGVLLLTFLPIIVGVWTADPETGVHVNFEIAVGFIDAVIIGAWALARWPSVGPLITQAVSPLWLLGAAALAVPSFVFATVFLNVVNGWLGVEIITMVDGYLEAGYGLPMIVLSICVLPAVFEELAFRGIIFNGLLTYLTRTETVVVSSLMFMIVHMTAFGVPQLVLGVVLALLRLRTRSILPCVALHFAHNFLCVADELWWSG